MLQKKVKKKAKVRSKKYVRRSKLEIEKSKAKKKKVRREKGIAEHLREVMIGVEMGSKSALNEDRMTEKEKIRAGIKGTPVEIALVRAEHKGRLAERDKKYKEEVKSYENRA